MGGCQKSLKVIFLSFLLPIPDIDFCSLHEVMMELGNDIINDIYEANYVECRTDDMLDSESEPIRIRRATSDCDSDVREAWIKTKYIGRAFVIPNAECVAVGKKSNKLQDIVFREDGWFVRRTRRKRIELRLEKTEKSSTSDETSDNELLVESNRAIEGMVGCSNDNSSDDEDDLPNKPNLEKLENFNSDLLLYRSVHNLPVMCYAVASGASKNWKNAMDSHRSPIHQAVLSVGFLHFKIKMLLLSKLTFNSMSTSEAFTAYQESILIDWFRFLSVMFYQFIITEFDHCM